VELSHNCGERKLESEGMRRHRGDRKRDRESEEKCRRKIR